MGRLPRYLNYIKTLPQNTLAISATTIARDLSLGEVQVRKDLAAICGSGKPKVGYGVDALMQSIRSVLGEDSHCEAVIIGAGKLGLALLSFRGFAEYGITISAAFDNDISKTIGTILPTADLPDYCALHQVEIGIITVPSDSAQEAADMLIRSGVKAIWCFAAIKLNVPSHITVQYENMALSLAHLHQKII